MGTINKHRRVISPESDRYNKKLWISFSIIIFNMMELLVLLFQFNLFIRTDVFKQYSYVWLFFFIQNIFKVVLVIEEQFLTIRPLVLCQYDIYRKTFLKTCVSTFEKSHLLLEFPGFITVLDLKIA